MNRTWTFGKKIAAGFALSFVLMATIGVVAYRSINTLSNTSQMVAHTHLVLEHIDDVFSALQDAEIGGRGFIITGDESFLKPYQNAEIKIVSLVNDLRELTADNPSQQKRIAQAEPIILTKLSLIKRYIEMRKSRDTEKVTKLVQTGVGQKIMDDLRNIFVDMEREERILLKQRAAEVEAAVHDSNVSITLGTLVCLLMVSAAGMIITRSLTTQIGAAVQHMQSSSSELQVSSNQQTMGSREQSTAMKEITTTMNELLVTSKQIAESAQRVAQIAEQTAIGARSGDQTVTKANDAIGGIKRQVDLIVIHMLDLGKKSQQIGGILEIINELAEQTNILAINATIEAAGAGENGKRFAVVADEIRKLADRVGGSTKEIRGLIDDIRAAVNTTVMTTEGGTKAVEAGALQFSEVAIAFRQIVSLVSTTTEATREIELSTKQQSTAVSQVNIAVSNVAQAARETEVSSSKTLQTATELTNLSRDLLRLIQPQAST
ncbi:MAG: CHASE3 domain-containing protein [Betaproteobacteria bacterium]